MINCQEALELLYDIIDREASEIDTQEVKEHLSKCGKCLEKYKLEESVNDLIQAKIGKPTEDTSEISDKVEGLKIKIMDHLDAVDEEDGNRGGSGGFFNLSKILVSARRPVS